MSVLDPRQFLAFVELRPFQWAAFTLAGVAIALTSDGTASTAFLWVAYVCGALFLCKLIDVWLTERRKIAALEAKRVNRLKECLRPERDILAAFVLQGSPAIFATVTDRAMTSLSLRGAVDCLQIPGRIQRYELSSWARELLQKHPDLLADSDPRAVVRQSQELARGHRDDGHI